MQMRIHDESFEYKIEDTDITVELFIHEYGMSTHGKFRVIFELLDVTKFMQRTMKYTYLEIAERVEMKINDFNRRRHE